jgi:hypothetical protein
MDTFFASDEFHIAVVLITAIGIIVLEAWLHHWLS